MSYDIHKSTYSSAPGFVPGLGEMGRRSFAAAAEVQDTLFDTVQDMNGTWLAHAQSEIDLASELLEELTAARSIPDVAAAWQQCMSRRMDMVADDVGRIFAHGEKLLRAGARVFSNGPVRPGKLG